MRCLLILPLLLVPASLAAAPPARPTPASRAPIALPSELTDPAMADKMQRVMGAMSRVMLDLPVGEIEAAIAGRPATPAERKRRVRDSVDAGEFERQVARSGPMIQGMTRALVASLPSMIAAVEQVSGTLEAEVGRAVGNLPDPTYPKR